MVKKKIITNTIVFFLCLFSFIQSEITWLDYDFSSMGVEKKMSDISKEHSFGVEFKGGQIPYYVKVEVTSDDSNPAPRLCFSNKDQNCNEREQLVKNPNGKTTFMWLRREQFEKDGQELYVLAVCPTNKCSYTIKFKGDQSASLPSNYVYSYLVTSNNREMRFEINGQEKNVYLTVGLHGSSKASMNIDGVYNEGIVYKNGRVVSFFLEDTENSSNLATVTVKGAEGDYLTISTHIVNTTVIYEGLANEDILVPNGPEVTGYLEKEILNEECFPIDFSKKYKDIEAIYLTGKIHTKYAWFYLEDEKRTYLQETEMQIDDGLISYLLKNNKKMNYICLELPIEDIYNQRKMAFTISLSQPYNLDR